MTINKSQLISEIAKRLEMVRKKCGYKSRRAFAITHGLKLATYRGHELGENEVSVSEIIIYAEKMKISTTWILLGGDSIYKENNDLDQVKLDDIGSKNEIGKRLEISRKVRGYSRIGFSKACFIDVTTIRTHETGISEIRVFNLISYCFVLDISLFWLLTGKGNPLEHHKFTQPSELEPFQLSEEIFRIQRKLKEISISDKDQK
jgi:hypothetical protein